MKKLLVVTGLVLSSIISYGQTKSELINKLSVNGNYSYEQIIDLPGKSKTDIYNGTKLWFGKIFKSSKNVIQTDVPNESLIGNGNVVGDDYGIRYHFKIITMIKDNKMKVTIEPVKFTDYQSSMVFPSIERYIKDYKENNNGVFSSTGTKSFKEFIILKLYDFNNRDMITSLVKEINNYNNF